jgi:Tfp pilus assembly protein PilF
MHYIVKQHQESISALNTITRFDPQNAEAYFMLGLNFRSMGDKKRALNALQTATEFDSKLIDAWLVLSEILESDGNPKAEQYLKTALAIEPNNINTLHSMAYFYQNHDNVEKALELYKHINRIQIDYGDAYLNAGILYLEQSNFSLASEQFGILVAQQPLNPVAHFYNGYTFNQIGNIEAAKSSLENAISLNEDYAKAIELLAELNKK